MLKEYLGMVIEGKDLTREKARAAMEVIMSGQASEAQIGAFLTALRMKGEVSVEVAGFAEGMRAHAAPVALRTENLLDIVGTGGDCKGTFNISTTAAFVLAGAGLPVAKHGNKGVSSPSGAADVLSALGVKIDLTPEQIGQAVDEVGVGFLYAPVFHGAMKYAAKPRKELGFRTVFNILGPLTNPAGAENLLVGVYDKALTVKVAEAIAGLGVKRAMVVCSQDGMDEISSAVPTAVAEVCTGKVKTYEINPADYGFAPALLNDYLGGTPAENAEITLRLLKGAQGPKRDIVVLNAAAGLVIGGMAKDIEGGIKLAVESIDSGAAFAKLEALRTFTRRCGEGMLSS